MIQVIDQTYEEKLKMYMENCTKEELAKMLIDANRVIDCMRPALTWTLTNATFTTVTGNGRTGHQNPAE